MGFDLSKIVDPILGSVLADHCTAKRLILVIEADSPTWASQLKFIENELLQTLNVALPLPISDIEITVRRKK